MAQVQQRIPRVTDEDVARVVRRDMAPSEQQEAISALSQYGAEAWHPEAARVRLAALKLADGSLVQLRKYVELACLDYRDVLISAEYPAYRAGSMQRRWPRGGRAAAVAADWAQYSTWLSRGRTET